MQNEIHSLEEKVNEQNQERLTMPVLEKQRPDVFSLAGGLAVGRIQAAGSSCYRCCDLVPRSYMYLAMTIQSSLMLCLST